MYLAEETRSCMKFCLGSLQVKVATAVQSDKAAKMMYDLMAADGSAPVAA